MGSGRLRGVVAHGGSTVLYMPMAYLGAILWHEESVQHFLNTGHNIN